MANLFTQQQVENILRPYGFTGPAQGGAAQAFIAANPNASAAYDQAVTNQVAANQARMATGASATPTSGAMPVGIEPLHQFERAGLTSLGTYQTPQAIGQAASSLSGLMSSPVAQQYMQPMTQAEFDAGVARYTNPYQQQVTDQAISDIRTRADEMRNRIAQRNPGARSFGSSSQGVQLASLAGDELDAIGRTTGELGARGFEGAVSNLFNERSQGLTGLSTLGNLGVQLANVGGAQQSAELDAYRSQIGAGSNIRGYNQGVSDIAMQNYMNALNYPNTQLTDLGNLLGAVQGNSYSGMQPSDQQRLGGGLYSLGSLF